MGIVGLGLLGGSLARALRGLSSPPEVLASCEDERELQQAVDDGLVQRASTPERIASTADLVVYATPSQTTARYLEEHAERWRAGAIVTDVSPVKRWLAARALALGLGGRFVPSHPVLADARAGQGARADLFAGVRVWLVPLDAAGAEPARRVEAFWRALGGQPLIIDAERHDQLIAWTTQLPQLTATALASALAASGLAPDKLGPDGRAATRAAAESAAAWEAALLANADLLEDPLMALEGALGVLVEAVRTRDPAALRAVFESAARWRQA